MTRIREEEYGTQTEECMAMSVKFIRNYKKMCKKMSLMIITARILQK